MTDINNVVGISEVSDNEAINSDNKGLKEVENLLKGYTEQLQVEPESEQPKKKGRKKKGIETEQEPSDLGINSIISGALLILMIDLVIPNIMVFANNKLTKTKMKVKDLQLTKAQKDELIPLADEAAKKIALKGDPLTVFILSLVGIYGINLMSIKASD